MKILVGCYYFFSYVSVSLFLAGLLEYNLALRDECEDNRELDRPMVLVLGSIFMLACFGSSHLKIMDLQYHSFAVGVTSFPHSVMDIVKPVLSLPSIRRLASSRVASAT